MGDASHCNPRSPGVGREGPVIITLPNMRLDDLIIGSRDSLITFNIVKNITLSNE